jgi:hypothetical protein
MGVRRVIRSFVVMLAVAALAGCGATAANAATILFLNPSSIRAGFQIEIRATCGDNTNPAFVHSAAFGSVTLVPNHGILRENVTIPRSTRAGTYNVNLDCASGQHSTAKLAVIGGGFNPTHGPHTGGGEMASTTGAKIGLYGGALALLAGLGIWLAAGRRRRAA